MKLRDRDGFFAHREALDLEQYLQVDYYLECIGDPQTIAAQFCSEQSTAQWQRVGVEEDFRPQFGAKILDLEIISTANCFSYPVNCPVTGPVHQCQIRVAHPHGNFGPRIPNLLTAIAGEGPFFSPNAPLVKLLDIHFPQAFISQFAGPQFGLAGIRALLQVYDRPIFFGVIKPNIGLPPEPLAEAGYQGWMGGLDVAKDDEMLADIPNCPLQQRSLLLGEARQRVEQQTGQRKMYLANITDEADRLCDLHDIAVANGANALLVNTMTVGLGAVRALRRHAQVPLVGHFAFIAPLSRLPGYGIHSRVITKLQRLAGFDAIITPGFGTKMMTTPAEVLANVKACLDPMGSLLPVLPVPGGSEWAGTLEKVYRQIGSVDFGFIPGRGVFSHPHGPQAGAESICQAWEACRCGIPINQYAESHSALKTAIEAFT